MKAVVLSLFLAFALVQCYQDVHTSGNKRSLLSCFGLGGKDNALRNIMKNGKPVTKKELTISPFCARDMEKTRVGDASTGVHYNFQTTACDVTADASDKMVSVKSKSEGPACGDLPTFQAVYLPQEDNALTFMILDPAVAHWFFTRELGGCDIFVAIPQGNRDRPIVIHSNLNSCGNKPQNLRRKGEAVDQMLLAHPGYTLVARVYAESQPGLERNQAKQELQRFQAAHNGVKLFGYDNWPPAKLQSFQFIGHYDKMWNFILKGEINGQVTKITL